MTAEGQVECKIANPTESIFVLNLSRQSDGRKANENIYTYGILLLVRQLILRTTYYFILHLPLASIR